MKYLDRLKTKNRLITSQPKLPITQIYSPEGTAKTARNPFDSNNSRPRRHISKKNISEVALEHRKEPEQKQQEQQAKIENGELKLLCPADDLTSIIVGLTRNDLSLQKKLLLRHCQRYDPVTHFWTLRGKWEERAAILEYDAGLTREDAEVSAAEMYHLSAFMDELLT